MKVYRNLYEQTILPENLFQAWDEFRKDKKSKVDVQRFEQGLERNIFELHRDLETKSYQHGPYKPFYIQDPKQRLVNKATVRDRILHHAVFIVINPIFEEMFIPESFSCRIGKGTHKGVGMVEKMLRQVSSNGTKPCFALKCDIKKFFDSVDHAILLSVLAKRIKDEDTLWLLREIIGSFSASQSNKGLPIGNLTSQLFANIYLNELDYFIKHSLKISHYARYTDDFVIIDSSKERLQSLVGPIQSFLSENLALKLHPNKITIRKFNQGIDFLGYIIFPKYRLLRTKTSRRIFKKLSMRAAEYQAGEIGKETLNASLQSYLGVLSHANSFKLSERLKNEYWFLAGGGRSGWIVLISQSLRKLTSFIKAATACEPLSLNRTAMPSGNAARI